MRKYRTGILDDHPLFAEGVSEILEKYNWMDIVFTGQNGKQLFNWLTKNKLDLLLLDINLGEENGLTLLERLKQEYPDLKVIILTTHQPADIGLSLKEFKGDAYLLKISGRAILETAFSKVIAGERYLDANLIDSQKKTVENPYRLTKREMEIIAHISQGKSSKEIAKELFLSEMTIQTHRKNINEKLGSKGLADMMYKVSQIKK